MSQDSGDDMKPTLSSGNLRQLETLILKEETDDVDRSASPALQQVEVVEHAPEYESYVEKDPSELLGKVSALCMSVLDQRHDVDDELLHQLRADEIADGSAAPAGPDATPVPSSSKGTPGHLSNRVVKLASPKEISKDLRLCLGTAGRDEEAVLADLRRVIEYSVAVDSKFFMNQLFAQADPAGVAADWLGSSINTSVATYEIAPVFSLMERSVVFRLCQIIGWAPRFTGEAAAGAAGAAAAGGDVTQFDLVGSAGDGEATPEQLEEKVFAEKQLVDGLFLPGGTMCNTHALACGRQYAFPEIKDGGMWAIMEKGKAACEAAAKLPGATKTAEELMAAGGGRPVAFVSEHAHYSTRKAMELQGFGRQQLKLVPTGLNGRMLVAEFEKMVEEEKAKGNMPFYVVATAGTTVYGAYDDVAGIVKVAKKHNIWVHVDGAWGGGVIFSRDHRQLIDGIQDADSATLNFHKWGGTPQQCSAVVTRHPTILADAFATRASYLFQPDKMYGHLDNGDKTILCGRRNDALKAWMVWQIRGTEGFASRVDHALAIADSAASICRARTDAFRLVLLDEDAKEGTQLTTEDGGEGVRSHASNVCFYYFPPSMRESLPAPDAPFDEFYAFIDKNRDRIHKVAPAIKKRMQKRGTALCGFQPITTHRVVPGKELQTVELPNFFRAIFLAPSLTTEDIAAFFSEVDFCGRDL